MTAALKGTDTPEPSWHDGFRDALQAISDECGNESVVGWGTVNDVIAAIRKDMHFYHADRMTRIDAASKGDVMTATEEYPSPCCFGCGNGRGWWVQANPETGDAMQVQCPCDGEATPDDPWDPQRCIDKINEQHKK